MFQLQQLWSDKFKYLYEANVYNIVNSIVKDDDDEDKNNILKTYGYGIYETLTLHLKFSKEKIMD